MSRTRMAARITPLLVAATAPMLIATAAAGQDDPARAWAGVTQWSGSVRVEITREADLLGGAVGSLEASAHATVRLDQHDVRDGPPRVIWLGEGLPFSAQYDGRSDMGDGAIVATESGEGISQDGSVELFVRLNDQVYQVDIRVGQGIPGNYTVTYVGGFGNESGTQRIILDVLDVRTDEIALPKVPGPLSGSQIIDVGTPAGYAAGSERRTGTVSWSLTPCTGDESRALEIDPLGWNELVFDALGDGAVSQMAVANNVVPRAAEPLIWWTFPDVAGVEATTRPEDPVGNNLWLQYEPMPENNEDFGGDREVKASLPGCTAVTSSRPVRFFFDLTGTGNPDETGVPNWFYYWQQTTAGHGLARAQVHYLTERECTITDDDGRAMDVYGLYYPGTSYVGVCDAVAGSSWNKVTGEFTNGIDTYAATLLHELEHKRHHEEWWASYDRDWEKRTGLSRAANRAEYDRDRIPVDRDRDDIPDDLEAGLGMGPWQDTNRCKMTDEHYLAWLAEGMWQIGAADAEDWAAPGKQYGETPEGPAGGGGALCGIASAGRTIR